METGAFLIVHRANDYLMVVEEGVCDPWRDRMIEPHVFESWAREKVLNADKTSALQYWKGRGMKRQTKREWSETGMAYSATGCGDFSASVSSLKYNWSF